MKNDLTPIKVLPTATCLHSWLDVSGLQTEQTCPATDLDATSAKIAVMCTRSWRTVGDTIATCDDLDNTYTPPQSRQCAMDLIRSGHVGLARQSCEFKCGNYVVTFDLHVMRIADRLQA